MAHARKTRALLYVGGTPLTREAMRVALARFALQVIDVAGVSQALDRLDRAEPDAVLVDDEGLETEVVVSTVEELLRRLPGTPVGVVSADPSPVRSAAVIRAGATAFLTKHTSLAEFRYALDRLMQGQLVVDPVVARSLLALLGPDADAAAAAPAGPHLTPVEKRVLTLAADGFLNKQIATRLGLSPLTVKNHLARIRARLGATDTTHAVATALRTGLLD